MSIGEVLANARRRAGLSVAQVSQQTRIRETIIAGIEGDDYSACGGDFYARGHIRSIAAAVGADPEPLIEQYDSARLGPRAATDEVTEPLPAVPVPQRRRPAPVTPAGVRQSRPPAEPVTPTGRRQRRRGGPAWAVVLGVALVAGLGFAGYLLADTGHAPAPSAGAHRAAPHRAGQASHAAPATGSRQAAAAPAVTAPAAARRARLPPLVRPRSVLPAAQVTTAAWPAWRSTGIPPRHGIPTGMPPPGSGTCIRARACWWTWAGP